MFFIIMHVWAKLHLHLNPWIFELICPHVSYNIYVCVCVCVCEKKMCEGSTVGGCIFILLIQGQLLIMQSEYMETLQEHMH